MTYAQTQKTDGSVPSVFCVFGIREIDFNGRAGEIRRETVFNVSVN